jgi:hypothetical protein
MMKPTDVAQLLHLRQRLGMDRPLQLQKVRLKEGVRQQVRTLNEHSLAS